METTEWALIRGAIGDGWAELNEAGLLIVSFLKPLAILAWPKAWRVSACSTAGRLPAIRPPTRPAAGGPADGGPAARRPAAPDHTEPGPRWRPAPPALSPAIAAAPCWPAGRPHRSTPSPCCPPGCPAKRTPCRCAAPRRGRSTGPKPRADPRHTRRRGRWPAAPPAPGARPRAEHGQRARHSHRRRQRPAAPRPGKQRPARPPPPPPPGQRCAATGYGQATTRGPRAWPAPQLLPPTGSSWLALHPYHRATTAWPRADTPRLARSFVPALAAGRKPPVPVLITAWCSAKTAFCCCHGEV